MSRPIFSWRATTLGTLTAFASLLSCGRDAMGPSNGVTGARSHGIAFDAQYPPALSALGTFAAQVVAFDKVVVVIRRADGSVALTRVVEFGAGQESVELSLDIPIAANAPAEGELVQLSLAYVNAQGDTVFRGGPSPVRAVPQRAGESPPPPVAVQLRYSGTGADAVAVRLDPRTLALLAGDRFALSAQALSATGSVLAGTPLVFSALDAGLTLDTPTAGAGSVGLVRGTARVEVRTLTGLADTATFTIAPRPASLALVSGGAQAVEAGTLLPQPVVVQLNATDGGPISGATVNASITTGGGALAAATQVTDAAGRASFTWTLGATPGVQTINVSSESVSALPVTATATIPPATRLVLRTAPPTALTAGVGAPIIVEARRADDQLATTFVDTVTLALTAAPSGGALLGTVRVAAVGGVATFDAWRIERAGSGYVARMSATGLTSVSTSDFAVNAAAASRLLLVAGDAQTAEAGTAVPVPPRVRVTDAFGNPVTGVALTLDVIEGNGTLAAGSIITNAAGEASLPVWTLGSVIGRQQARVSAIGLPPIVITATATAPTTPLRTVVITTELVEGLTAGASPNPAFRVEVRNDAGVVDQSFTDSVRLSIAAGPASAQLLGTTAVPAVQGVALFSAWRIEKAGLNYRIVASANSATPDTSAAFEVAAAEADTIIVVSGGAQTANAGTALPTPIVVRLTDAFGNPIASTPLTVVVATGGGTLATGGPGVTTDATGTATLPAWTLGPSGGAQTITVSMAGGPSRTITATATVVVTATRLVITQEPSASQIAGVSGTPAVVVQVRDASNAVVTSFTDTLTLQVATNPAGGVLQGTLRVAAVNGVATFAAWNVRKAGAGYRVMVSAPGLVPDTTVAFTVNAAAPDTLTVVSGGGQTAYVGDTLAAPIIVRAVDAYGNPAIGAAVTFAVTAGSGTLVGGSTVVDSAGHARLGSWRMGTTPMTNTITASVGTLPPLSINATAIPLPPTIELAVFGSNVVGYQRAGTLNVKLLQPAPAGGLTVSVVSDHPTLLSIAAPGTVTFAAGATTGSIEVSGLNVGTATVRATATGYTPDTLLVPVSLNLISLPSTQTVALNQTRSVPVQLAAPAPSGGVKVAIVSTAPSVARVVTDTVLIAAGSQVGSATVEGMAIGSTTITATNPNYAPSSASVSVTAALNITNLSVGLNASFGAPMTVRLESSGNAIAAPSGGIALALTAVNPSCVSVPATGLISAGESSVSIDVTYGGSATTLPCSSVVRVTGPSRFDVDSVIATVQPVPTITAASAMNLASGLQRASNATLGASNHGGVVVTVRSLEPSLALIAPNDSTAGAASQQFTMPLSGISVSFVVQTLEGIENDTVQVEVSAPGFTPDTMPVRIWKPAFVILGLLTNATTLTPDDPFWVSIGTPNSPTGTTMTNYDEVRAGAPGAVVQLISDSTHVSTLVRTAGPADSVSVPILTGDSGTPLSVAAGGVAIRYLAQGVGILRVHIAGFRALTNDRANINVTAPSIGVTATTNVGSGLQRSVTVSLSAPAPSGGTVVTVKAAEAGKLLLAPNLTTVGGDSVLVTIAAGSTTSSFVVQALEGIINDTVAVYATSPGFVSDTGNVRIYQSVYEIQPWVSTATTLTGDRALYVRVGTPSTPTGDAINTLDTRRAGAEPLVVTILNDSVGVGRLVTTSSVVDSLDVSIDAGNYLSPSTVAAGGFAYRYTAAGVGQIRARIPGLRAVSTATRTVTVSAPELSLNSINIGSGLQRSMTVFVDVVAPTGGLPVMIRAGTPGKMLLSNASNTVGQADSLLVTIPQGSTAVAFQVQALEGIIADTVTMTASGTGLTSGTGQVRIWQPVLGIVGLTGAPNTLDANDNFQVRVGTPTSPTGTILASQDVVRPGAPSLIVTLASSNSTVAQLVTQSAVGDTVRGIIRAGSSTSTTALSDSGTFFDPLTVGTTTITASIPGYRAIPEASQTITVSAPALTMSSVSQIGAGLAQTRSVTLSSGNHGGVNVVLKSSNPSVARVAPNNNTLATDSIIVSVPNGTTAFNYTVVGIEGTTGAPVISASAPGFTDASSIATIIAPALDISGLNTTATVAAADDPFQVRIGIPEAANSFLSQTQPVRFGHTVTVTLSNSAPGVIRLVSSAMTGDTVTVSLTGGMSVSAGSVGTGGAAVDYLTAGSATVRARASGFVLVPFSDRLITITP